ncbi:4'-phosphopantetheinyl transferase family protein [Secundilactobacillus folii]|uniref:4'-phosphopantetheinyl transferase domain-containing protein n=1 Tax=Secundilactobacillus folii TaxID=2678357 RepID=A0A7X2XWE3_9LACO|nr:hypothetical protein [Secundilactobacillus folii]MTV82760.1 hypothetical protein [Secundilactobacillus folii]
MEIMTNSLPTVKCYVLNVQKLMISRLMMAAKYESVSPYYLTKAANCKSKQNQLLELGVGLLLERELGVHSVNDIYFGQHGKPYLADHSREISISHAGSLAVLAIANQAVGVDVEPLPDKVDRNSRLALKKAYGDNYDEQADISPQRFGEMWTQLEATVKLDGQGLWLDSQLRVGQINNVSLHFTSYNQHMICTATNELANFKFDSIKFTV